MSVVKSHDGKVEYKTEYIPVRNKRGECAVGTEIAKEIDTCQNCRDKILGIKSETEVKEIEE